MSIVTLHRIAGRKSPAGIAVSFKLARVFDAMVVVYQRLIPVYLPVIGVLVGKPLDSPNVGVMGPEQGTAMLPHRYVLVVKAIRMP